LIVTVWPAIVAVPDRVCVAVLAAAEIVTDPPPVPELPLVTVRKELLLTAVQLQLLPCGFATVKVVDPPLTETVALVGLTVSTHWVGGS
jgi:hypothetical protein